MKTDMDNDLERRLRSVLRQELDREHGPDPAWDESPAARRVTEPDHRRPSRWTLRVLAVAAIITIGVGSAILFGAPDGLSGPNGWIAQSSGGDIYLLAVDQEVRRVIGTDSDGVSEGCPAFSPDGRQLAYGRVAGEVTWNEGTDGVQQPSFATYQDSTLEIANVADDGQVTGQLTIAIGDGLPPPCPVWSPTGDRIAFAVPRTSTGNPTQSADGSEVRIVTLADRSITVLPDLLATDLEFSPDGTLLAIASGSDLVEPYVIGSPRIHLYELASGTTRTLEGTLGVWTFTWSPDGGRIAYQASLSNHQELRLIDLATEEDRVISEPYGTVHGIGPVWSPDGESILYQRCVGPYRICSGERHEVVLVRPDDLSADGTPREEAFTLFDRRTENTERELWPRWVTWSPDGEYLLFSAWPYSGRSLLGVAPSVPGSPSTILVSDLYPKEDPEDTTFVYWEPFAPIQTWGRLPSDGAMPTPASEESAAELTPSPAPWVGLPAGPHLLLEGTESGVPITVSIAAPRWNGEPNGGVLCWGDSVDTCAGPPDGVGLVSFEGREYSVYGEACEWSTTRPETPATTIDEFIDALANQGSRNESAREDITVDGYPGKQIVLAMHPVDIDACDQGRIAMFGLPGLDPARLTQSQDLIEEVWAVDVDGLIVVLDGLYYPDTPQSVVNELRAILGSATFE